MNTSATLDFALGELLPLFPVQARLDSFHALQGKIEFAAIKELTAHSSIPLARLVFYRDAMRESLRTFMAEQLDECQDPEKKGSATEPQTTGANHAQ